MLSKLDIYIIKKFLGTFFFTLFLIICVIVVFDISEKLQDFIEREAPIKGILFVYYLNKAPYLANMFSPLFIFISVIYFSSKMASNSEIVAILAGGVSFNRFIRPYMISALILAVLSFYLNNFLIPHSNKKWLKFEDTYYRNKFRNVDRNIHLQLDNNTFVYMSNFNADLNLGTQFSIEKFEGKKLTYKLLSDNVKWDSTSNKWQINNYMERHIDGLNETINRGITKDTSLALRPEEFKRRKSFMKTMDFFELNQFIEEEKFKGSGKTMTYEVEKHQRGAYPFATFILTLIGVSISSRKVRGGIGLHIGIGLLISFSYILFMQISSTFATNSGMNAFIAVWIPNALYTILALYLLKKAPK